ncbi:DUF262 domain-containing protein [Acinetobacter johnsonii]|uniref:DUF262 domain-containing protein n=1 Tax=Acinetobacter johnsonii TaxID=40214 RepID=UPI00132B19A2|nr:DUF262 domain-containing protein [Acinetobacter johnsonii]MDH1239159.1 DUF262 domain-containing protein [Acinetobacter johnsonii]MWC19617.1 DUF262 domain-containing protein [Acinetobacter johnsonii]
MINESKFSQAELNDIESEIIEKQRKSEFDTSEYPVEVIVSKFQTNLLDTDKAELFIPDYQREYIWPPKKASEFIESIILDLPIPYIYVAVVNGGEDDGRLEIVDGSQRIRTLVKFLNNDLELEGLKLLSKLNSAKFKDLPFGRQLRFKRKSIRWIELVNISEDDRRELFRRINTGGKSLESMEIRFGSQDGPLLNLINEIANDQKFKQLCPISPSKEKIKQRQEMILRFFAYRLDFDSYKKEVATFLNDFMDKVNTGALVFDEAKYKKLFYDMLSFVENNFSPLYFKKNLKNNDVAKIRFEAISIGSSLALSENPNVSCRDITWLTSSAFSNLTRSDASNSRPKLIDRTYFVKNKILDIPWEATSSSYSLGDVDDE